MDASARFELPAGETRPCEQMEEAYGGLRAAMQPHWGGGAYGEVVRGGVIRVGDEVGWEPLLFGVG